MKRSTSQQKKVEDASGFAVFAGGSLGEAHVMAHEMLDQQREGEGLELLGRFLETHTGEGSDWVHLQWHMAVFEIWAGRIDAARERFEREILPAVFSGEALTDGPSLLWRLALAGDSPTEIDWEAVREAALKRTADESDPFVEAHHLLAMAGAGDIEAMTRWLDSALEGPRGGWRDELLSVGWGLRSWASGAYGVAGTLLADSVAKISGLGGSRAQNQLFGDIATASSARAGLARAA